MLNWCLSSLSFSHTRLPPPKNMISQNEIKPGRVSEGQHEEAKAKALHAFSSPISRRSFLAGALITGSALGLPFILTSKLRGEAAAARRIRIGIIGCGRMAQGHVDFLANEPDVEFVAVCDVDALRAEKMRRKIVARCPEKSGGLKVFADYRELLADPSVDAVSIAAPDHWHALLAVEASLAGKDIYLEKPCTLTIAEGLALTAVAKKQKSIIQVGSQQRSLKQFVRACEIVRNGGIGKVGRVQIGLPVDLPGGRTDKMSVPAGFDYARWLGPAEAVYYTEDRTHPQNGFDRPGWMRCENFCKGIITNWGTHHIDIAHWALDLVHTGPEKASGHAEFLKNGLWDVHGAFAVTLSYAGGLEIAVSDRLDHGVRFEGDKGWLFVGRDPIRPPGNPNGRPILQALDAQDRSILTAAPGPIRLGHPGSHFRNWLDSIISRDAPVAPIDQAHRSCSACQLAYSSMKLGRPVAWDPEGQKFPDDVEAARLMAIPEQGEFSISKALRNARF